MSDDTEIDLGAAIYDPSAVFGTPEAVADHPALTSDQKIEVLRQWAYDALETSVAGEEGMPGLDNDLLYRILTTLHRLTGGYDVDHPAPTKQHGLGRFSARRSRPAH